MNRKTIILIICTLICIGITVFVFKKMGTTDSGVKRKDGTSVSMELPTDGYLTVDGQKYKYNTDIRTMLFLGVDRTGELTEEEITGANGQADCILLFVMDTKNKTANIIQISRETMTDVKLYDISGNYISTENMQICLQYAYGDGAKKSSWLMKDVVSNLFFGLSISSYIAMDIDGIATVTDTMGGVNITIPEDYTRIDERFSQDTEITLDGAAAERYVRYRDTEISGSNNNRMQRQTQFLKAMANQIQDKVLEDSNFVSMIYQSVQSYVTTDMTISEMEDFTKYTISEDVITLPGETVQGEKNDEYHVNYDEFQKIYLDMFYKKV